jgi:MinD superfamily P-loop ATPase
MKQLVIISGKGGTGKTSLAACFAALEKKNGPDPVIVDCDVDAANLHLLLGGETVSSASFSGPELAVIDRSRVADRERCESSCRFGAISGLEVDPFSCVGCGVCRLVCGEEAVRMEKRDAGIIYERDTPYGKLFSAELEPGQPGFGGLITALRARGEEEALRRPDSLLLIDGSPGIGCQVIASLTGCDLALVVTEPGKGAIHDFERIYQLLRFFGMKARIVINRCDLDQSLLKETERYCFSHDLEITGRIPFNDLFRQATLAGKPAVELGDAQLNSLIGDIYQNVRAAL